MKSKLFKNLVLATTILSAVSFAISCGNQAAEKTKDPVKPTNPVTPPTDNFDDKVVWQTSQNSHYPLNPVMNEIVKYYNENMKNTADFLPVVIQDSSVTKAISEDELAAQVATKLATLNNNYDQVPNILLNSIRGSFIVNQYEKLLDFSNTEIKKELFDEDFYNNHNKIPGTIGDKIYSIPFDISSVDALVFNLDIMHLIFEQIKAGGGTIDENSEIYKKVVNAKTIGNAEIPAGNIWKHLKTKNSTSFSDYTVNDDTFKNYANLIKFAGKIYENLELDPTLTEEEKTKLSKAARDAKVLMVDYEGESFKKYLYSKLSANDGTPTGQDKYLWKLVSDAANKGENYLEYKFIEGSEAEKLQNILKDVYSEFVQNNKQKTIVGTGTDQKSFKSVYYGKGGVSDWASWDIRTYETAIAIAPHVGINQSKLTPLTKTVFAQGKPEVYDTFAKPEDVYWTKQLTNLVDTENDKGVFLEGGSSLVVVNTTESRNRSTIKFITWMLKGNMTIDGQEIAVRDYIRDRSAYVVPTKDRITYEVYTSLKTKVDNMQNKINELNAKQTKTPEEQKELTNLEGRISFLMGAMLSLADILEMKGIDLKNGSLNNDKKIPFLSIFYDEYTNKIRQTISSALTETTETGKTPKTAEEFLATIKSISKS